jgi:hypothetical protein
VKQHQDTIQHNKNVCAAKQSNLITKFCSGNQENIEEKNKIAAIELAIIYHNVIHNLSYNSLDCGIKLFKCFISEPFKKVYLGRTKAEALVVNVMGPQVRNIVLGDLISNNLPYAVLLRS